MSVQNYAAYLDLPAGSPFDRRTAPMPIPADDEILIRNHYTTVGPLETYQQPQGKLLHYTPIIVGCDVAGTIVKVGKDIRDLQEGQRIIALTAAHALKQDKYGAYQDYVVVRPGSAIPLADHITCEEAVVLPLALGTSSHGLFGKDCCGLELPAHPRVDRSKEVIFMPGAASSVGIAGVQLAALAGYSVVTTSSAANIDLAKRMGAKIVIDRNADDATEQIAGAIRTLGTLKAVMNVAGKPASFDQVADVLDALGKPDVPISSVNDAPEGFPYTSLRCHASSGFGDPRYVDASYVGDHLFGAHGFLAAAIDDGRFIVAPEPLIVGHGLGEVQKALDYYMEKGVSAAKVVIEL